MTKRNPDETYENFKKRRLEENQKLKQYLRGKLFYNPYPQFLGTTPEGKPIWSSPKPYRKEEANV